MRKNISVLLLRQWSDWEEKNVKSEQTAIRKWKCEKVKVNNVVEI